MTCEKALYLMVLYLNSEIEMPDKLTLESHLSECKSCREEMVHMKQMHGQLAQVPLPEPDMPMMQMHFYNMLDEYKGATVKARSGWFTQIKEYLQHHWQPSYGIQLAMGLLLLIMGWAGGYLFGDRKNDGTAQINQLTAEVQQMRETMLLTMLEQPAATDRLKAVNYTQDLDQVDDKVIDALLQTLNNDPNVNVRLVTVEALHKLAGHPRVRQGLIEAITQQDSPLIQIALADVMVDLHEKRSVNALKKLLQQKDIDLAVKSKIENSVNVLM